MARRRRTVVEKKPRAIFQVWAIASASVAWPLDALGGRRGDPLTAKSATAASHPVSALSPDRLRSSALQGQVEISTSPGADSSSPISFSADGLLSPDRNRSASRGSIPPSLSGPLRATALLNSGRGQGEIHPQPGRQGPADDGVDCIIAGPAGSEEHSNAPSACAWNGTKFCNSVYLKQGVALGHMLPTESGAAMPSDTLPSFPPNAPARQLSPSVPTVPSSMRFAASHVRASRGHGQP